MCCEAEYWRACSRRTIWLRARATPGCSASAGHLNIQAGSGARRAIDAQAPSELFHALAHAPQSESFCALQRRLEPDAIVGDFQSCYSGPDAQPDTDAAGMRVAQPVVEC